ncbi:MAG: lytic murein transglycosylase [Pseudomonadota bacterium]
MSHVCLSMKNLRFASCLFSFLVLLTLAVPLQVQAAKSGKSHKPKIAHESRQADEPEFTNFTQWRGVAELIDELSDQHGLEREVLKAQFSKVHYLESVVKLINPPPPSKVKNWTVYRERFIEPTRLRAGAAFWKKNEAALNRAETEFGVPAEIIVGILGVETMYGKMTGNIRVVDALATLAFAYPPTTNREARMTYFRNELKQVFLLARDNDMDPLGFYGSFAGAIGLPQFMPGSIRRFAVDFDGDGKIDLRNSPADAIGSIASFLSQHGWRAEQPLVFPVNVSSQTDATWPNMIGQSLEAKFTRDEFKQAGIAINDDVPATISYGLVDLQDGDRPTLYWLGTTNFFAIAQYNRSFFYAMTVIELGKAVRQQRRHQ